MSTEQEIFSRTELLFGADLMDKMHNTRVILFGVGGVGGWCAESLIRSGIGHLTIVDSDLIAASNINRQLMATTQTVGQVKVEVLKNRLLDINPYAEIVALQKIYSKETSESFNLESFDYVIDAIDSLENKVHLIQTATRTKAKLFSSMGAALKMNPAKIEVAEFWKVRGCPLAAALRRKLKQSERPSKKFFCVYSEELLKNKIHVDPPIAKDATLIDAKTVNGDPSLATHDWSTKKAQINGTIVHATAIFGFTLAGLVIQDLYKE